MTQDAELEGTNEDQRQALPFWAELAVIARCARRFADVFVDDAAEPAAARVAVRNAVSLAEAAAVRGGNNDQSSSCLEVDGQFFDHYDVVAVHGALLGYAEAARNTHSELVEDLGIEPICRRAWVAIVLAIHALEAGFPNELGTGATRHLPKSIQWATFGEPFLKSVLDAELELAAEASRRNGWTDESPVPEDAFGSLWPSGTPEFWPDSRLSFRPRARIIRTIGDRLISGPEAAVIELVKNSYDADAAHVRITFLPPLQSSSGEILFEDDGHGMSYVDVRDKWMEPATSDKKVRSRSPGGRKLLGSKGIGRFAAARLGSHLELASTARLESLQGALQHQRTRIVSLDWDIFERTQYLEDVSFPVETTLTSGPSGTTLRVSRLRDDWTEASLVRLHDELRRLVSPLSEDVATFKIFMDLSRCTPESAGFDGRGVFGYGAEQSDADSEEPWQVQAFPLLDACDYAVDGVFDEDGAFAGTMTLQREGFEAEQISISVPIADGEDPCGIVLVRLSIFDREAEAIRSTAAKAGFGRIGVREARKLLDKIAGVAIYREGFRVRPYGDAENDWLTLDAKRVQNPTIKIGRNQVAGVVVVDNETSSNLVERSSREGLEENGSFRRLQSLILTLLAEVVEPRRRKYRISAGVDKRQKSGFREAISHAEAAWSEAIISRLPEADREDAKRAIARESGRLTEFLKELEERQARLEAQVTLGLIVGEVMHQGNTPLAFIETEVDRLRNWWPTLLAGTAEDAENRSEVPKILNGMGASATSLRTLFKALSPLAGARRGPPQRYSAGPAISGVIYLFQTKAIELGVAFEVAPELSDIVIFGYAEDLATSITNLVDNAMHWLHHYRIENPKISITAEGTAAGKATITFADNGQGVPEEFEDQLFDVGFSLRPNGTGLGLSIAREAVLRSGGELVYVQSESGAKFALTLPTPQD